MDQELLSTLVSEVERLQHSSKEIAARLYALGDVEIAIDDDQLGALEGENVTSTDVSYSWMVRI